MAEQISEKSTEKLTHTLSCSFEESHDLNTMMISNGVYQIGKSKMPLSYLHDVYYIYA